jgi:hypothetical protein
MPLCTAQAQTATTAKGITGADLSGLVPADKATPSAPAPVQPKRAPAHYLWAVLIARIYEVFPLVCPICGGEGSQIGPDWDLAAQPAPDYEVDQRINW